MLKTQICVTRPQCVKQIVGNTRRHIPEEGNFPTGYPQWSLLLLAGATQTNPQAHQLFLCAKSSDILPSHSRWKCMDETSLPTLATYPPIFSFPLNLINPTICGEKYKPRSFHYTAGSILIPPSSPQSSVYRQPVLRNKNIEVQTFCNTLWFGRPCIVV